MMSSSMIQLQFELNQPSFSERFRINTRTIDSNPQGNNKKVEVVLGAWMVAILINFDELRYIICGRIYMNRVLLLLVFLASVMEARSQKGEVYLGLGSQRIFYTPSTITVKRNTDPAFNFTLFRVKGEDEGGLIFDTAPQFSFFIGYYFSEKKFGLEFSYDHGKYFARSNQVVHLKGVINDKYIETDTSLTTPDLFRLDHTDGTNYTMINIVRWLEIFTTSKNKFSGDLVLKAGAGIVHPRTNSTVLGVKRDDQYHVAGYVTGIESGIRLNFFKHYYIAGSFKGCFANYSDFLIAGGKGKQTWFSGQLNYFIGGRINIH